jgi:hypothetical protein
MLKFNFSILYDVSLVRSELHNCLLMSLKKPYRRLFLLWNHFFFLFLFLFPTAVFWSTVKKKHFWSCRIFQEENKTYSNWCITKKHSSVSLIKVALRAKSTLIKTDNETFEEQIFTKDLTLHTAWDLLTRSSFFTDVESSLSILLHSDIAFKYQDMTDVSDVQWCGCHNVKRAIEVPLSLEILTSGADHYHCGYYQFTQDQSTWMRYEWHWQAHSCQVNLMLRVLRFLAIHPISIK